MTRFLRWLFEPTVPPLPAPAREPGQLVTYRAGGHVFLVCVGLDRKPICRARMTPAVAADLSAKLYTLAVESAFDDLAASLRSE